MSAYPTRVDWFGLFFKPPMPIIIGQRKPSRRNFFQPALRLGSLCLSFSSRIFYFFFLCIDNVLTFPSVHFFIIIKHFVRTFLFAWVKSFCFLPFAAFPEIYLDFYQQTNCHTTFNFVNTSIMVFWPTWSSLRCLTFWFKVSLVPAEPWIKALEYNIFTSSRRREKSHGFGLWIGCLRSLLILRLPVNLL
jgi:hypothetical protein